MSTLDSRPSTLNICKSKTRTREPAKARLSGRPPKASRLKKDVEDAAVVQTAGQDAAAFKANVDKQVAVLNPTAKLLQTSIKAKILQVLVLPTIMLTTP